MAEATVKYKLLYGDNSKPQETEVQRQSKSYVRNTVANYVRATVAKYERCSSNYKIIFRTITKHLSWHANSNRLLSFSMSLGLGPIARF